MEWIKMDLHHHTNEDKDRKNDSFNYEEILKFYDENNIKIISITNHNKISKQSISSYKKIIKNNNYNIKILPGIELEFKMEGNKNNGHKNVKGHLNLIFHDEYEIDDLDLFFDNTYNPNSSENFKDYFPYIINKLQENNFNKFIIMIDFAKSNPIDFYTIKDNSLLPWLYSIDILEGRIINPNTVKQIHIALGKASCNLEKAIFSGTDASNTQECIKYAQEIKYVLTEPTFDGIIKMVQFPASRISNQYNEKPALLNKYIESFSINGKKTKLEVGLNTIIGRRGSGKSYLLNSLIKKLKPNEEIDPNNYTSSIEISGEYDKERVIKFKQDEISKSLSSFIYEIANSKQDNFDLIKHVFGQEYDRGNFLDSWDKLFSNGKQLKKAMHSLLKLNKEIRIGNISMNKAVYKNKIRDKFINLICLSKNDKYIKQIDKDLELITDWKQREGISPWLKNEIEEIERKLSDISQRDKYKTNKKIELIYKNILSENEQTKSNTNTEAIFSRKSEIIVKIRELKKELKINLSSSISKIQKIIDFYSSVVAGKEFINKNITVSDSNEINFLKFDTKISEIIDVNSEEEAIEMFRDFVFSKKTKKKKTSLTTLDTMKNNLRIVTKPKINNEYIDEKSPGTQHEIFMDNILKIHDADIILLDQPDDDLDALTIQKNLIDRFTKYFNDKQWIVVTHDPKIVINADSRKIIMTDYSPNKKNWFHEVDNEEIRKSAFEIMDSKREFPKIRAKKYMEEKW